MLVLINGSAGHLKFRGIPLMLSCRLLLGISNFFKSLQDTQCYINDFVTGTIASHNASAYIAEIVRGGIQAVPIGQMEASQRSLGILW